MSEPRFLSPAAPMPLSRLAELVDGTIGADAAEVVIAGVAPLDVAGPDEISFIRGSRHREALATTRAGAVFCAALHWEDVPEGTHAVVVRDPQRAFLTAARFFYPAAMRPGPWATAEGVHARAHVDATARLEADVVVEPGAVVGPRAEIGADTRIGPNAVIGPDVRIGRGCTIGPNVTVQHALIGDRVIVHPGVAIGQDGFGYAMGPRGHEKIPQIGRVVIQDDVEIGANSTIDRGSGKDTVVGKGTKIDNLVQIAHNVRIGCHCVLVAHTGVSGSCVLDDYVVLAGKVGVGDHVRIGRGAQVAGGSNVADDIPPGGRWVGTPARPARRWMKELLALSALAANGRTAARTRTERRARATDRDGEAE